MPDYGGAYSARPAYSIHVATSLYDQDIPNNRSRLNVTVYIRHDSSASNNTWASTARAWGVTVGSWSTGGAHNFMMGPTGDFVGKTITIFSGVTGYLEHASNGTLTVSSSAYHNMAPDVMGNAAASGPVTLPTIPRESTPSFDVGGVPKTTVDFGDPIDINTNRNSSSFTHDLYYTFGALSNQSIATGVATEYNWTPPLSLMTQIPNATSGTAQIRCVTKNGATVIGEKTVNLTLTVPTEIVPDFTTVTHAEATTSPDIDAIVGAYLKGLTTLDVAITGAVGAYGSTVQSYKIEVAGQTINAVSGTTGPIGLSGTLNLRGTVTDSRARSYFEDVSINVLNYAVPVVAEATAVRSTVGGTPDANGTYLLINVEAAVQSLIVGVQKNNLTWRIKTRDRGDTTDWSLITADYEDDVGDVGFDDDYILGTYSLGNSYDTRIEVEDELGSITAIEGVISTGGVQVHYSRYTDGVGFGKYHEDYGDPDGVSVDARQRIYNMNGVRVLDEEDLDAVTDSLDAVEDRLDDLEAFDADIPYVIGRVKRSSSAVTLTASTWFILDDTYFASDISPTGGLAAFNTDSDGWTAPVNGVYRIDAQVHYSATVDGILMVKKNDTTLDHTHGILSNVHTGIASFSCGQVSGDVHLNAGDVVRLAAYVNGSAVWTTSATFTGGADMSYFGIRLVHAD